MNSLIQTIEPNKLYSFHMAALNDSMYLKRRKWVKDLVFLERVDVRRIQLAYQDEHYRDLAWLLRIASKPRFLRVLKNKKVNNWKFRDGSHEYMLEATDNPNVYLRIVSLGTSQALNLQIRSLSHTGEYGYCMAVLDYLATFGPAAIGPLLFFLDHPSKTVKLKTLEILEEIGALESNACLDKIISRWDRHSPSFKERFTESMDNMPELIRIACSQYIQKLHKQSQISAGLN